MPWYNAQALHIFAPSRDPFGQYWVEQILGEVLRPVLADYDNVISWVWVTRYSGKYTDNDPPLGIAVPQEFHTNGWFRYIVLRLHANSGLRESVHSRTVELAQACGCFTDPRGWIQYDPIKDVGGDRFIRNDADHSQRIERARLIVQFVDTTIRLMLHSLSRDTAGNWLTEPNMIPKQNPKGSIFESIRHLFCNATGVPTTVLLAGEWSSLQIGTYWMPPFAITGDKLKQYRLEVQIRY